MQQGLVIAGRYRLEEQVGAGSAATVWRATDQAQNRLVAMERLSTRGRAAADVRHPHLPRLLDAVVDGGETWSVLEYVPSRTWAQVLAEHGPMPPDQVARIGVAVADALAAVHAAGILHRDVNPHHVLLGDRGEIALAGFGASAGRPGGLAPEVVAGDEPTAASDVFSLGAAARRAIGGEAHLRGAGDTGPLADVLSALLRADPANRPDAAGARVLFERAAQRAAPGVRITAEPPAVHNELPRERLQPVPSVISEPPCRLPVTPPGLSRRGRIGTVGAALVAALAVGAAVVVTVRAVAPAPAAAAPSPPTVLAERAAEPCSLMSSGSLERFGRVTLFSDFGQVASCVAQIAASPGDLTVTLTLRKSVETSYAGAPVERFGDLSVMRPTSTEGGCSRVLELPAGNQVAIDVRPVRGTQTGACAVAEAAVAQAATALAGRGIAVRQPAGPADLLAGVDACALLTDADVARLPGVAPGTRNVGFGSWRCGWGSTTSAAGQTVVTATLRRRSAVSAPDNGQRSTVAGREVFALPQPTGGFCAVTVVQRRYIGPSGSPRVDVLDLSVFGAQAASELCRLGVELAGAAIPRLPVP